VRERWLRVGDGCGRGLAGMDLADEVYGCVRVCFGTGEETRGRGCGGGKGLLRVNVCAYWSCSGGGTCWDVGLHLGGGGEDGEIRVKD
jgi:hypothetical protein